MGPLYFANLRNTVMVCWLWASSVHWTPEATGFSISCSPPNYNPQLCTPHPPPQHNTHTYTQLSGGEEGGSIRSSLVVSDSQHTQGACVTVCYHASGNVSEENVMYRRWRIRMEKKSRSERDKDGEWKKMNGEQGLKEAVRGGVWENNWITEWVRYEWIIKVKISALNLV